MRIRVVYTRVWVTDTGRLASFIYYNFQFILKKILVLTRAIREIFYWVLLGKSTIKPEQNAVLYLRFTFNNLTYYLESYNALALVLGSIISELFAFTWQQFDKDALLKYYDILTRGLDICLWISMGNTEIQWPQIYL